MIQRQSDLTPAIEQTMALPAPPAPELPDAVVPAPAPVLSRADRRSAALPLDRTLARAVRQRRGARMLQRLQVTNANKAEVGQIKARYLAANPGDFKGWDAALKAAPSIESLRAQWPAPVTTPTAPQRTPELDSATRASTLTTTYNGKTIGPFTDEGDRAGGAKAACYYDAGGEHFITPDRDEHAGPGWKLYVKTGTRKFGGGWMRVDTLTLAGVPMGRG